MNTEESVEITAPTVDEAVILGITRLGVTRDEVDIEIVDEGSRGFLGLGARDAVVRITRRPPQSVRPEPQEEAPCDEIAEQVERTQPTPAPEKDVRIAPTVPQAETPETQAEEQLAAMPEPVAESQPAEKERREAADRPEPQAEQPPERPERKPRRRVERKTEMAATPEEAALRERVETVALDVAEHLFGELNVEVRTTWRKEDRPTLWVSLRGRDADALVGPRAQTLHASQYLMRALVHHKVDGNFNLVVDADGYRRRRRRSLEAMARKMADKAVRSGQNVRLRPMPAHERRLVHIALRSDERVKTESSGSGRHRAITIIPVELHSQE